MGEMDEGEGEGFLSLLIEGRFEECLENCSGYLTAITDVSKSRGLRPSVDFEIKTKNIPKKFKVCLTFLQCIYEIGQDRGGPFVMELESFFAQNSPIPFVVARTWIQLKLTFQQFESAKELLLAYLGALAETASQDERETFSAEKRTMYAELASLYIVHTLPALNQLPVAQKFLAMHDNSALITPQQRNQIYAALDKLTNNITKGTKDTGGNSNSNNFNTHENMTEHSKSNSNSNISAVNLSNGIHDSRAGEVNGTNAETSIRSNGTSDSTTTSSAISPGDERGRQKTKTGSDEGAKIVISVEQAGAALAALCVVFGVVVKRDSIGKFARKTVAVVGDAIFGS